MGKRVPLDEKQYRPVDSALVQAILSPTAAPREEAQVLHPTLPRDEPIDSSKVLQLERPKSALPKPPRVERPAVAKPAAPAGRVSEPDGQPTPAEIERADQEPLAGDRLSREKRVLLNEDEEDSIEDLVKRFGTALGTTVKFSHVMRATISLLLHAEAELIEAAKRNGRLRRPSNNKSYELLQYEGRLARILDSGLKAAPPKR